MITYKEPIEVPIQQVPVYDGTMEAKTFEVTELGQINTTNLIDVIQDWGVNVKWEVHGANSTLNAGTFHLRVLLERIGVNDPTHPDYDLPEVTVDALNGATAYVPADDQMQYETNIDIAQGTVVEGTYKLVTLLQLYGPPSFAFPNGRKLGIAGLCEGPVIDIFSKG